MTQYDDDQDWINAGCPAQCVHGYPTVVCAICQCDGLRTQLDAISGAAQRLLAALPVCSYVGGKDAVGDDAPECRQPGTRSYVNALQIGVTSYYCDTHKPQHWSGRDAPWAPAVRELAKLLEGT